MIHGQVICRQIRSPVLVLVGELHGVEFTVRVADLAGRLGNEHNRHALRSVALRVVGALGRHAHVMGIEQLLDPPIVESRILGEIGFSLQNCIARDILLNYLKVVDKSLTI